MIAAGYSKMVGQMPLVRRVWLFAILFVALGAHALAPNSASAHPHEFVNMRVEVKFDQDGNLWGFQYFWQFDEFFSAYAIEGQDKNKNGKPEQGELDALLVEILGNTEPIGYFTAFDTNHVAPDIGTATPVKAEFVKRQLEITFDVPLKKPVSIKGKTLRYAIYDNEFYIAMHHDPDNVPVSLLNKPKGCSWKLDAANPDEETVAYANSLGKEESSGIDLGSQFAEWVSITCK